MNVYATLVLIRHGQSAWNLENKFTGWVDVELTAKGIEEAKNAGKKLEDYSFDLAFTSGLKRAKETLKIVLQESHQAEIATFQDIALNERMYGDLQGLDKTETEEKFGVEQVKIWRRSYDVQPPNGESLKDTADRVIPYFTKHIEPLLNEGKSIIVAAHGNSLRALIMYLENLTPQQILEFEIGTAIPRHYELNEDLKVIKAENI
jgi:2,3-bisphosphoglycerate-dependent phosphoglycerate mutase